MPLLVRLWVEDVTTGTNASILGWHRCSGMPGGPLAPVWAKLARALLDNGERLDGFVVVGMLWGKFQPTWVPCSVATPTGTARLRCLLDLTRLVN
jgi:phosphatidylglycerol lysyltransferase